MRFEMSSKDVNAMLGLVDCIIDDILDKPDIEWGLYYQGILSNVKVVLKKAKMYGEKAFDNRAEYRDYFSETKERIEELAKIGRK